MKSLYVNMYVINLMGLYVVIGIWCHCDRWGTCSLYIEPIDEAMRNDISNQVSGQFSNIRLENPTFGYTIFDICYCLTFPSLMILCLVCKCYLSFKFLCSICYLSLVHSISHP